MYINFDAYIAMTFSHERVICYATFNIQGAKIYAFKHNIGCKWGRPISRVLSWVVIYLGYALLHSSSDLYPDVSGQPQPSLFGLASDGVCQARQSPAVR